MSTIIQQGRFTSTGEAKIIPLRSDLDWMEVYNTTVADNDTQTTAVGVQFYWQRGMAVASGIEYKKSDAANAAQLTTGFTLIDPNAGPSAPVAGTIITKASPPVCTAPAHGFQNGDTVAFSDLAQMPQLSTYTFTIDNVTTNTFELSFFDTNTPNFTQETSFNVRSFPFFEWKGGWAAISSIIKGGTTQVQLTTAEVEEAYEVGTVLRFQIPSEYGMTQLNGLSGTILVYNAPTNTYTIDIDSSSFTDFVFPGPSAVPLSNASVQVIGSINTNVSTDAVDNVVS